MQSDSDPSYFRLVQEQNEMIKQHILLLIISPGMWKSAPSLKWRQFAAIPRRKALPFIKKLTSNMQLMNYVV